MEDAADTRDSITRDVPALLVLAFLIRLAFVLGAPRVLDSADAIHYIDTADRLAAGDFGHLNPGIPVLYPLLAACVRAVAGDGERACMAVSFLASIALIPIVYLLALDLHGRRSARIAGLMAALWPWLVDYAGRVGPDALGCTLWFASVWLLARGIRRGVGYMAAAAMAFAALHLVRAEGIFLLAAAPFIAIAFLRPKGRAEWSRLGLFAGGAVVLAVACAFAAQHAFGHVSAGYRIWRILQDWSVAPFQVAQGREDVAAPGAVMSRYVLLPLARTVLKTLFDVLPIMLGPLLMVFLGVGLLGAERRLDVRLEGFVLAFAAAQWLVTLPVLSPEPRYLMAPVVVLSLWSARGVADVSARARAGRFGRWLALLPGVVVIGSLVVGLGAMGVANRVQATPGEPYEYGIAGKWMKENLAPGLIFTRKPQIGYYAGMPSSGPDAQDSVEKAVARAYTVGARYFVIDERYTAKMAPALAPLLEPANAPPSLKHLKSFAPFPQGRVTIYELAPAAP